VKPRTEGKSHLRVTGRMKPDQKKSRVRRLSIREPEKNSSFTKTPEKGDIKE